MSDAVVIIIRFLGDLGAAIRTAISAGCNAVNTYVCRPLGHAICDVCELVCRATVGCCRSTAALYRAACDALARAWACIWSYVGDAFIVPGATPTHQPTLNHQHNKLIN